MVVYARALSTFVACNRAVSTMNRSHDAHSTGQRTPRIERMLLSIYTPPPLLSARKHRGRPPSFYPRPRPLHYRLPLLSHAPVNKQRVRKELGYRLITRSRIMHAEQNETKPPGMEMTTHYSTALGVVDRGISTILPENLFHNCTTFEPRARKRR